MKYLRFGGTDENGMSVFGDVEDKESPVPLFWVCRRQRQCLRFGDIKDKSITCLKIRKTKGVPVFGNVEEKGRTCVCSC